jgi:hypothetical protein
MQACVAVGEAGSTIRTIDGVTWSKGTSPTTQELFAVDCPSIAACFAISTFDQIIATTDGGASWSLQSPPATNILWDVSCTTPTRCLVTGRGGVILSTTDGGAIWSFQSSGTTNDLIGVDCPGSAVCFAVGYAGSILALPQGPLPPWWTQPAHPLTGLPPHSPWYLNGVAPSPAARGATRSAPRADWTQQSASPSGSLLPAATRANVSRAVASLLEQIASRLRAIFS